MFQFTHTTPEALGISSKAILAFVNAMEREGIEMHSLVVARHGQVCAEGWWKPYGPDLLHPMYSFTKSLTSTAIGFAEQEGKLRLDERICDIFADCVTEATPANIRKATVEDLLIMGCGHAVEPRVFGENWIADFLAHDTPFEPGSTFQYNSSGSNLLAAILRRKTGENLLEYLRPRLFAPLGMAEDIDCTNMPDGTAMGGGGSRLHTDDMLRFIQFVANKGVWEGKQLLRADWFERATVKHIENNAGVFNGLLDWGQGYCYQYWRCVWPGAFRADGAFGQFGVVFTEQDAIVIITQTTAHTQDTLTRLWETIAKSMVEGALPADPEAAAALEARMASLRVPALPPMRVATETEISGKLYALADGVDIKDAMGVRSFGQLETSPLLRKVGLCFEDGCRLLLQVDGETLRVPVGMEGEFLRSECAGEPVAACGRWRSPRCFELELRPIARVGGNRFLMRFGQDSLRIEGDPVMMNGFGPVEPVTVELKAE